MYYKEYLVLQDILSATGSWGDGISIIRRRMNEPPARMDILYW